MTQMMVGIILNSVQWLETDTAESINSELERCNLNAWIVDENCVDVMVGDVAVSLVPGKAVVFIPTYIDDSYGEMLMTTKAILELDAG